MLGRESSAGVPHELPPMGEALQFQWGTVAVSEAAQRVLSLYPLQRPEGSPRVQGPYPVRLSIVTNEEYPYGNIEPGNMVLEYDTDSDTAHEIDVRLIMGDLDPSRQELVEIWQENLGSVPGLFDGETVSQHRVETEGLREVVLAGNLDNLRSSLSHYLVTALSYRYGRVQQERRTTELWPIIAGVGTVAVAEVASAPWWIKAVALAGTAAALVMARMRAEFMRTSIPIDVGRMIYEAARLGSGISDDLYLTFSSVASLKMLFSHRQIERKGGASVFV